MPDKKIKANHLQLPKTEPKMFNNGNPQSTPRTQMQDSVHVSLHTPHFINFPTPAGPEHLQLQLWLPESQLGDGRPADVRPSNPPPIRKLSLAKRKPQQSKHGAEGRALPFDGCKPLDHSNKRSYTEAKVEEFS